MILLPLAFGEALLLQRPQKLKMLIPQALDTTLKAGGEPCRNTKLLQRATKMLPVLTKVSCLGEAEREGEKEGKREGGREGRAGGGERMGERQRLHARLIIELRRNLQSDKLDLQSAKLGYVPCVGTWTSTDDEAHRTFMPPSPRAQRRDVR